MIPILRSLWDEVPAASKIPSLAHDMLTHHAGQRPEPCVGTLMTNMPSFLSRHREIRCRYIILRYFGRLLVVKSEQRFEHEYFLLSLFGVSPHNGLS